MAAKMDGASGQAAEVEALRQELEQEREMRQVIESELRERRAKDGTSTLGAIRQMLEHTPEDFAAIRQRAEEAERMVAALDRQLTTQHALRQEDGKALEAMARQLRELHAGQPPALEQDAQAGLTFPYATNHLKAMRDAAIEFWRSHDRSKPAPYGIQKEVQKFLAERTGENARKLAELAAAIKPDDLPK